MVARLNDNSLFTIEWTAVRLAQGPYCITTFVRPGGECGIAQITDLCCLMGNTTAFKGTDTSTSMIVNILATHLSYSYWCLLILLVDCYFLQGGCSIPPRLPLIKLRRSHIRFDYPSSGSVAPQPSVWDGSGVGSSVATFTCVGPVRRSDRESSPRFCAPAPVTNTSC